VEGYIKSGEYSLAMTLIDDALDVAPDDSKLITVQQECLRAEYDSTIQSLVDEVRVYMASNDYVSALEFVDSCIVAYPEELLLQQERRDCLSEYETYVIEESLRLAKDEEYQHALSLAEAGLQYFTSAQVTELVMVYKNHITVILGEMEMFQNNSSGGSWGLKTDDTDKYLEDNYGNIYDNSLSVGSGTVTYLVNFKYQTFSGTVAFPKGKESDGFRESATLTIYGDDEVIAEFVNVDENFKPEFFSLDVSSYEIISLKWKCSGMNIWRDWGYFATIFDGVLVPIPLELPV